MQDLIVAIFERIKVFPLIRVDDIRSLRKEYDITRSEMNSVKEYCGLESLTLRDGETYWVDPILIKKMSRGWG